MSNLTINEDGLLVSLYHNSYDKFAEVTGLPKVTFHASIALLLGVVIYFMNNKDKKVKVVNNKTRKLGHWNPEPFVTPIPEPYKNWHFEHTKPLPYRAFRHKYNITMGIRSMDWNQWFELDREWSKYHSEKLARIEQRGTELYETSPKATDAAYELLDEMKRYLPNRYPSLFKATKVGLDNLQTGESFNFTKYKGAEDPILIAAKLVQDDLAVMVENEDGNYSLEAGAIILAGFWRFRDKYQLKLNEIHTSGDVPQYNEKLRNGMTKFFSRLTCDKPVVRNNYFIQTDDNLGWSFSIGDENVQNVGWNTAKPATTIDQLYFRSERQSLRRLPKSGAIIFTIRTYFLPITELCKEPMIPKRLLDGINSWSEDVEEYKGYSKYADVLMPYLQQQAELQQSQGIDNGEGADLYPF